MKLLRQYEDLTDAEQLSSRLRNKGVMTFVSSKRSYGLSSYRTGAFKVGVWAVLPNQYEDAKILLNNKRHQAANPISIEEMRELDLQAKSAYSNGISNLLRKAITGVLLISTAVFLGVVLMSIIKNA